MIANALRPSLGRTLEEQGQGLGAGRSFLSFGISALQSDGDS